MKQKNFPLSDELFELLEKEKVATGNSHAFIIRGAIEDHFKVPRETAPDGTIVALNPENMAWARSECLKDGKTLNDVVNEIVEQARAV